MTAGSHIIVTLRVAVAVAALLGVYNRVDRALPSAADDPQLFVTGEMCIACHNTLVTPAGDDVSIGSDWRASMMAHSARDPYWQATMRREVMDHPASQAVIEDECPKCHMPMARTEAAAVGAKGVVFDHLADARGSAMSMLAMDGVSCTTCHQIESAGLGTRASFSGNFTVETSRPLGDRTLYGPFAIENGHSTIMHSASQFRPVQSAHIQSSELCATCHTLYTEALNAKGEVVGELPEQMPFQEWQHSSYVKEKSCQDCHMPVVADSVAVSGVLGKPRAGVSRHTFLGGNFFMLRMLNRFRTALGVTVPSSEMARSADRTVAHLANETATLSVAGARIEQGRVVADVVVSNLAGHKLPTGYPSRRAWIHMIVRDAAGRVVFESGRMNADGSIIGNDNDANGASFEPHYSLVERPDQVQIFETILAGTDGRLTTGLLTAVRYTKDNRLLPRGFDKHTADADLAVHGEAHADADFVGGSDRIQFSAPVDASRGPFQVRAALMFQPIGFRWAHNLGTRRAPEIDRFVDFYTQMADGSATTLAIAERVVN